MTLSHRIESSTVLRGLAGLHVGQEASSEEIMRRVTIALSIIVGTVLYVILFILLGAALMMWMLWDIPVSEIKNAPLGKTASAICIGILATFIVMSTGKLLPFSASITIHKSTMNKE